MRRGNRRPRGAPGHGGGSWRLAAAVAALACITATEDGVAAQQAPAAGDAPREAELVLLNGRIVTLDPSLPEATALAAADGRILAVGSDEDVRPLAGADARVIDLEGRLAIPGFIEGHGHFMSLGRSRMILDLTRAGSWAEIVDMVAEAATQAAPGEWIEGRGWHQEKWDPPPERTVEGVPVHDALSAVSPQNPVLLGHASGHASFANARALELAEIGPETPDPAGGEIVRDETGRATGLLRETAQRLVGQALERHRSARPPERVEAERREQARLAAEELLRKGVTTFHDAGSSFETIDFYRRLADEGALPVRLYVMVRRESNAAMDRRLPDYRMIGYGGGFLTVRAIKRQIDGALGAHGAWLLEPYEDLPRSEGLVLEPVEEIEETARIALRHGFQVNTHAIGDRANREVLDLYERAFGEQGAGRDLRWRIEHAQHLHPADIPRFAELGVVASMQAVHACSDGPWVVQRIGERRAAEGAYVWQSLLASGAVVTNGTDVPVEDVDPIASFHCSVTRQTTEGAFYPGQTMTRLQALRSYTEANAWAAFEEEEKGTLAPGKLADLVVLSEDILTVPADRIREARVLFTVVGGRVAYEAAEDAP